MGGTSRSRIVFIAIIAGAILLVAAGAIISSNSGGSDDNAGGAGPDSTQVSEQDQPTRPPQDAVRVLVQSANTKELWMQEMAERFNASNPQLENGRGVFVNVEHTGSTFDQDLQPVMWSPANPTWVEQINQEWRDLNNNVSLITGNCPGTISMPIGIAMWQPMAEALGWPDESIAWADIVALATDSTGWASLGLDQWGEFKYGHGHPAYSNSGRLSVVAEIYAALDKTEGLTLDDVWSDAAKDAVSAVETAVFHYGKIDTDLLDKMVIRGPNYLHAVTNYEGNVIRWNQEYGPEGTDQLRFPLVLIYPSDGTFWMDHPLCILDGAEWVTEDQIAGAKLFRDFLLEAEQQTETPKYGIRPADPNVPLDGEGSLLTLANGVNPSITVDDVPKLPEPGPDVTQAVIEMWYQVKKPSTVLLVIDVSGSMEEGGRIKAATEGAQEFVRQMQPNDEIVVLAFHDEVVPVEPAGMVGQVQDELIRNIGTLYAGGQTALYAVTLEALDQIEELQAEHAAAGEKRIYGIVLMTDGEPTDVNVTESQVLNGLPDSEDAGGVRIYTIAYGEEANPEFLVKIANRTNGKFFESGVDNIKDIYFFINSEF